MFLFIGGNERHDHLPGLLGENRVIRGSGNKTLMNSIYSSWAAGQSRMQRSLKGSRVVE